MTVDFQQVRRQVNDLGENAPARQREKFDLRKQAEQVLLTNSTNIDGLRYKVSRLVDEYDSTLRCAVPVNEALDQPFSLPVLPIQATILAADGSQILPDRHAEVEFCLINVGAIQMRLGDPQSPAIKVESELLYDKALFSATGIISEARLALMRDLRERGMLLRLAESAEKPVVTFTDGPMELWGAIEAEMRSDFKDGLKEYLGVLSKLCELGVITAGYVDKPSANLVVRLLEVAMLEESKLREIIKYHPLRGVTDIYLYKEILSPGERSAVFSVQSKSAQEYQGALALHFFYLNVGRPGHPAVTRVEFPAWVAKNPLMLDILHAVLISQCRILGSRPYPYLLHRAHEVALVSLDEKDQVNTMILQELRKRGVEVGEKSNKQANKDLVGRSSMVRRGR
jgi:hypothetical protein